MNVSRTTSSILMLFLCFCPSSVFAGDESEKLLKKGWAEMRSGNFRKAIFDFSAAARSSPRDLEIRRALCTALIEAGEAKLAIPYIEVVCESAGHVPSDLVMLAEAHAQSGAAEESVILYRQALELSPQSLRAKLGLAEVLIKQNQLDDALCLCKNLLRSHKDPLLQSHLKSLIRNAEAKRSVKNDLRASALYLS